MRTDKQIFKCTALMALLLAGFSAGSIAQDTSTIVSPEPKAPTILATSPAIGEMNVNRNSVIEITFSSDMNAASINGTTLMLYATYADTLNEEFGEMQQEQITDNLTNQDSDNSRHYSTGVVNGTITYANKVAVFAPDEELNEGTLYTVIITNGVRNTENIALGMDQSWGFTTSGTSNSSYSDKQNNKQVMKGSGDGLMHANSENKIKSIDLGKAGHFVILAKIAVKNNSASRITGHIGEGSVANSVNKEKDDIFKPTLKTTSGQITVLQSNLSDTTSSDVIEAIEDMMYAYSDASMQHGDDSTSYKNQSFKGTVLTPGVHEWSDTLHIVSDVTLSGSANDVWLIKVGDNLTIDENVVFTLTNGARADNIFWYVEGDVTIGKNAHFEGIILSMNEITLGQGATLNGRMFSQTSISLDDNTVTEPVNLVNQATSMNK